MTRISLLFFCLMMASAQNIFAQDFEVPENYVLKVKEDYAPYEKDIIAAAKWLQVTPFEKQKEKRREVSAFVFKWINGSPTVYVGITDVIMDFENKNPGMLILYMAACAQYELENNDYKNYNARYKFALHTLIDVYKKDEGLNKDKKLEKLAQAEVDGKLDSWIAENLPLTR